MSDLRKADLVSLADILLMSVGLVLYLTGHAWGGWLVAAAAALTLFAISRGWEPDA